MSKLDNLETWQKASVITSLILTVVLILNTSVMLYQNYQTTFTASMMGSSDLETLDIGLKAEAGRPSPLRYYLDTISNRISAYYVGGTERTNAETGLIVAIDGTNIAASASVTYYVEAKESTGQGSPYRFLQGNSTSVTVNGADLDLSNQTTIENHLTAMGLDTSSSWTIDYYVYVKAEATGAISGENLTSEITYQKFDSVEYDYGTEVEERYYHQAYTDYARYNNKDGFELSNSLGIMGYQDSVNKQWSTYMRFDDVDLPQGQDIETATIWVHAPSTSGADGSEAHIYMFDELDTATFSNYTDAEARTKYPVNGVSWIEGSSWSYGWYDSPEVTDEVQRMLDKAGWESGDPIGFKIEGDGDVYRDFHTWTEKKYGTGGGDAPRLKITYMSYSASWYPIGPVSVLSMPLGQTLGAVTVLALSCYTVFTALYRGEKKK